MEQRLPQPAAAVLALLTVLVAGCLEPSEPVSDGAVPPPETALVADDAAAEPDVILTSETLDRWIAATQEPEVRAFLTRAGAPRIAADPARLKTLLTYLEDGDPDESAIESQSDERIREWVTTLVRIDELEKAVQAHGFESAQEWSATTARVLAGFVPSAMAVGLQIIEGLGIDQTSQEYIDAKARMDSEAKRVASQLGTVTPEEQDLITKNLDRVAKALELRTDGPPPNNAE